MKIKVDEFLELAEGVINIQRKGTWFDPITGRAETLRKFLNQNVLNEEIEEISWNSDGLILTIKSDSEEEEGEM